MTNRGAPVRPCFETHNRDLQLNGLVGPMHSVTKVGTLMQVDRLLRIGIPGLCVILTLLLGLNTVFLLWQQTELREKDRLNHAVLLDTLKLDTSELEKLIARYAALNNARDAEEAKRAYQNLLGVLENWPDSEFGVIASRSVLNQEKLAGLLELGKKLSPYIDDLDNTLSVNNALVLLHSLGSSLQQTNRFVTQEIEAEAARTRESYLFHQNVQTGLALVLFLVAVYWIWQLLKTRRSLESACRNSTSRADHLAHLLDHDPVTGLINHKVFADRIRTAVSSMEPDQTLSILSVDLESRLPSTDHFAQSMEDAILASTADLLRHVVDPLDNRGCLARSSGKGFLIMTLSDTELGLTAHDIANRVHDLFLRPVPTEQGSFLISPAIGLADNNTVERDPVDIIRNADLAVTNAVTFGRRQVVGYQPAMRAEMERRVIVEHELARAIEANECLPHFQPQFNLKTGRIFGVEALARWYHSELGWISPSEFIPIAESNGDIVSLGWKILETSCSEVQLLPSDLSLSVNLSVAQILSDDVVAMLEECLGRTGLPASRLKLEVTETTLMSDLQRIRTTLSELRSLGISISLDDFGVGYSALSYLTEFHWDEIKIDRSFASKAVKDRKLRDVLKLVLGIAETMGSKVLIEGIETVEQRDVLVDIGCLNGQGYLFGGPMAIDDITTLFFPDHNHRSFAGI